MPWRKIKRKKGARQSLSRKTKPVWDLYRDGITYSALSKFFIDRERFRLAYVEGWSDTSPKEALEFGNAFHWCMEQRFKGKSVPDILRGLGYYEKRRVLEFKRATQRQIEEFHQLIGVAQVTFEQYTNYWTKEDKRIRYLGQEQAFDISIAVPQVGRKIRLRGRIDGVFEDGKELWIMENKTKSNIDETGLLQSLPQDLQTMIYAYVGEQIYKRPVRGVLYNVIRKAGIKRRKGRATRVTPAVPETMRDYMLRVKKDIQKRPDYYFMRWKTELEKGDLKRWVDRTLNPTLIQLVKWWESIKHRPFDPWTKPDGTINDLHWQRPFGVYDFAGDGRRGDFFDLLTKESTYGLVQRDVPFPELA